MKLFALSVALCATLAGARADDWYVDPVLGDDANSGTTQGDPWRSVTHALAVVPASGDVLHLAPGVYDAASGEVYPLPMRPGVQLVGTGGSAVTVLEGGSFGKFEVKDEYRVHAQGITLRGASTGIWAFYWHDYDVHLHLVDVRIQDMSEDGIFVDAYAVAGGSYATAYLERVQVTNCGGDGARITASTSMDEGWVQVDVLDSEFSGCGGYGLVSRTGSGGYCGSAYLTAVRCLSTTNGQGGIRAVGGYFDFTDLVLEDSLVADNGGVGVEMSEGIVLGTTIAGNFGVGLSGGEVVMGSILYGNGDDLAGFGGALEYSLTNDPDAPSGPGNLTGDPLFADPASGDYRLRFGSPCVDSGDPAAPPGADVDGLPRPLDGDLDAAARSDMGAHELAPLRTSGEPAIGATVDLELWGPAGGSATLFWRRGLVDQEIPTIYGVWYLGRPRTFWAQVATAPWPPATVGYLVPNDPSLVGLSVSFQALSTSGVGTLAFTNPITLTFVE